MSTVLFVCTGNICRSPFAERYSRHLAQQHPGLGDWDFASAGVGAMVGSGMEDQMSRELVALGGDPEGFRARSLTRDVINEADLIVAMETFHRSVVLDDFPALVRRTFTLGQLARIARDYPAEVKGADLLGQIGAFRHRARDEDNIRDPYRRSPEVAHEVAGQIAGLLDELVPRLAD
ncbi:low molecular weight phosphatase family protein [Flexivirga sp. ID2601S]|uniref:Low molecular weight phosphatase family protein n=1 Tax=Flexivirga aerilata TaxID=1656889 RepID=A0A849AMB1_9MICO|nr:low molecular weight phosphatase family protein [Flexivirga aerilata]NNG37952.1 low molecular weight phosphatase family protein [Flexivirga aerilata]